jgi:hypothetical protein
VIEKKTFCWSVTMSTGQMVKGSGQKTDSVNIKMIEFDGSV